MFFFHFLRFEKRLQGEEDEPGLSREEIMLRGRIICGMISGVLIIAALLQYYGIVDFKPLH